MHIKTENIKQMCKT